MKIGGRKVWINLVSRQQMYASEVILQKIGNTGHSLFQYQQVSNLVSLLMKTSNMFRPLTTSETVLTSVGKLKLFSRVYKFLSMNVKVSEHNKAQWEKGSGG